MLDDSTDVVERCLRETCVLITREGVNTVFRNTLVYVHTGTVVTDEWLGHESRRLAVRMRNVVHAVLQDLNFVSLCDQRVESDADLTLTCCTYFVVVHLYVQAHLLHR